MTTPDCVVIGVQEGTEATTVIEVENVVVDVDFWQLLGLEQVESMLTVLTVAVVVSYPNSMDFPVDVEYVSTIAVVIVLSLVRMSVVVTGSVELHVVVIVSVMVISVVHGSKGSSLLVLLLIEVLKDTVTGATGATGVAGVAAVVDVFVDIIVPTMMSDVDEDNEDNEDGVDSGFQVSELSAVVSYIVMQEVEIASGPVLCDAELLEVLEPR
ncbi:Fc.00g074650.m01.CDS01 [Cosmosporella sp. VM-42]